MREVVADWCPRFSHILFVQGFPESCHYGRQLEVGEGWATVTNCHVLSQLLKIPKWTCRLATHSLGCWEGAGRLCLGAVGEGKRWNLLLIGGPKALKVCDRCHFLRLSSKRALTLRCLCRQRCPVGVFRESPSLKHSKV